MIKRLELFGAADFDVGYQRWSRGHKARGQGQGHKKISRPRTDPLEAKDQRHRRKCSPKKRSSKIFSGKKSLQNFFSSDLYSRKPKKRSLQIFCKVSGVFQQIFNGSKIVLSSSRGQSNFWGLEAKAKNFKMCPRGQGRPWGSTSVGYIHLTSNGRRHNIPGVDLDGVKLYNFLAAADLFHYFSIVQVYMQLGIN